MQKSFSAKRGPLEFPRLTAKNSWQVTLVGRRQTALIALSFFGARQVFPGAGVGRSVSGEVSYWKKKKKKLGVNGPCGECRHHEGHPQTQRWGLFLDFKESQGERTASFERKAVSNVTPMVVRRSYSAARVSTALLLEKKGGHSYRAI